MHALSKSELILEDNRQIAAKIGPFLRPARARRPQRQGDRMG